MFSLESRGRGSVRGYGTGHQPFCFFWSAVFICLIPADLAGAEQGIHPAALGLEDLDLGSIALPTTPVVGGRSRCLA